MRSHGIQKADRKAAVFRKPLSKSNIIKEALIMEGMMKVAVMTGIEEMEFVERPIPQPGPGQVQVQVEYVGICGSDLHYYEAGRIGNFIVQPPFVLGHECAGTITALGEGVTGFALGDRVALEPNVTCGECEFCRSGKYNLCPDVQFFATPPVDGVFAEYVTHPALRCFKLPDNVSSMAGSLIEPLAVGFHAAARGEAHPGQTAMVFGSGCIGLVSMLALKTFGVSKVYVSDIVDSRLEKAMALGATGVCNSKKQDFKEWADEVTGGKGFDLLIETAGTEITTRQAIDAAKKGSNIVLVGYSPSGEVTLPIGQALDKELTFKCIFRYRDVYPAAIQAVADGRIPAEEIPTHVFEFDDLRHALHEAVHNKETVVKGVVKIRK